MNKVQIVGVSVRECVHHQSLNMCVPTDRVKSGVRFNIRFQTGCIHAFWSKMVGIIAPIFCFHYTRYKCQVRL